MLFQLLKLHRVKIETPRSDPNPNFRATSPVFPSSKGKLWHASSNLGLAFGGAVGQLIIWKLCRTKILHYENYEQTILNRPKGTPVISASNHKATLDDWLLCSIIAKYRQTLTGQLRYVMGAEEVMFWTPLLGQLAAFGRILPIRRGHGVNQLAMQESLKLLSQGGWIHIYPQGRILHTREEDQNTRLKWGIGRLVAECPSPLLPSPTLPKILPMWHVGMDEIVPNKRPYKISFGHRVSLVIGKEMEFDDQVAEMRSRNCSALHIRKAITDQVQVRLGELREEAWAYHDSWN